MPTGSFYYINEELKVIKYFESKLSEPEKNYQFCGYSQMPKKGACSYYAKKQSGFKIIDGNKTEELKESSDDRV